MKAKQEKVAIKYSRIGNVEDMKLDVFADASLGTAEKGFRDEINNGNVHCFKRRRKCYKSITLEGKGH